MHIWLSSEPRGVWNMLKDMMMLYPLMEAIRSGGDLRNVGGSDKYVKDIVCPDGCVMFRLTARWIGVENPFIFKAFR